jgi:hypothetical protein
MSENYETIMNSFNEFISSINKDPYEVNIENFNKILKDYKNYAYIISFTNNNYYLNMLLDDTYIFSIINPILDNIININEYFKKLYDITNESDKNKYFNEIVTLYFKCLIDALIALYQYYIIYKEGIDGLEGCHTRIFDNECLLEIYEKFIKEINNYDIIQNNTDIIEKINEILKISKNDESIREKIYDVIYIITVTRFNELFFSYESEFAIRKIDIISNDEKHKYLKKKLDNLWKEPKQNFKEYELYYKIGNLLYYIIDINGNYLEKLNENKYITIPIYSDSCWFISFLTGLTYSDKNKELLLGKLNHTHELYKNINEIDKTTKSNVILYSLVYYIIHTITKDHKKYSNDLSTNCEIFKNLKKLPEFFLNKSGKEIKEELLNEKKIEISRLKKTKKRRLNDEEMIKSIIGKKLREEKTNPDNYFYRKIIKNIKSHSLYNSENLVLKKFYEILDIKCLFIYDINSQIKAQNSDLENSHFDIILVSKIKNPPIISSNYIQIDKDDHQFEITEDKLGIKFKENDYELDYILIPSDDKLQCYDCGHSLCALHYNNEEYYYDSRYIVTNLTCGSDEIQLPCSLIKKKWTTTLRNEKKIFCIDPCTMLDNYITHEMVEKKQITTRRSENLCYTYENIVYCYVKKNSSMVEGGSKGKNTNKNKNVTRKVHFDKKLNKYYVNYDNNKIYLSK